MQTRHNIYALIHKALRLAMSETLVSVGRLDASDPKEVSDAIVRVRELLQFCRHHLEVEEAFVHPALEARRPGSSARIAADHVGHTARIDALERKVEAVARAPSAARAAAAFDLYGDLAAFVGENLVHMHEEETAHNRELWAAYTDGELVALEDSIKARHTPDEMKFVMRWMLPAMSPAERGAMVLAVRSSAPPPVYEGVVALAKAHVDSAGWRKLELALAA
jgi:hypothetical protein